LVSRDPVQVFRVGILERKRECSTFEGSGKQVVGGSLVCSPFHPAFAVFDNGAISGLDLRLGTSRRRLHEYRGVGVSISNKTEEERGRSGRINGPANVTIASSEIRFL